MCKSCEGHRWREGSVNALIISCSFQLLTKDPYFRLGAYGRLKGVREQPFLRGVDWCALREKRVQPPEKPKIVKVSSTDSVFISCHKQFLLTLHVNCGNSSFNNKRLFHRVVGLDWWCVLGCWHIGGYSIDICFCVCVSNQQLYSALGKWNFLIHSRNRCHISDNFKYKWRIGFWRLCFLPYCSVNI